ncbi:Gfo/Idh/MocA family oxidoreductase [Ligilactobacillus salivarius]|nr:Gfo/Idh/MocA family oxidoreductase [Ligilactobacillus salivarius]
MHKYNWGIIGTGWIAHEMADALNEVNSEIYAVSNPNEESLYKFAKEKNVKHTFINPDEMITDPNVDIIYIATPHISHYDYIKKALNAGKHVFAEKAITISAKQLDEVIALAKSKNLILTEGFTLYHMPIYEKVRDLISSGKLGDIKLVQVNFGSLKDYNPNNRFFAKELAGGALLDIGGYATAFARMFLNEQPEVTLTYVEINNYPRATEAKVTYTLDAHTESHEIITAGDSAKALNYEVMDMQRYISQGHDDGQLSLSQDVAHILNRVRDNWGMNYTN